MYDEAIFKARVRELAKERGLKISRLSGMAFMNETQLGQILCRKNKNGPTAYTLCAIADALGVATDDLLKEAES